MAEQQQAENPLKHSLEHRIGQTLRGGVFASAILLLAGLIKTLIENAPRRTGPPLPTAEIFRRALAGDGEQMMQLGLLVLIATPVIRVAVLVLSWSQEGNVKFALIAAFVLLLLALSFTLGVG
jgi:uncharacterized membrane protein